MFLPFSLLCGRAFPFVFVCALLLVRVCVCVSFLSLSASLFLLLSLSLSLVCVCVCVRSFLFCACVVSPHPLQVQPGQGPNSSSGEAASSEAALSPGKRGRDDAEPEVSLFEFFDPDFDLALDVGDAIKEEVYPNALEFFQMALAPEEDVEVEDEAE